jgi:hypothetical protein
MSGGRARGTAWVAAQGPLWELQVAACAVAPTIRATMGSAGRAPVRRLRAGGRHRAEGSACTCGRGRWPRGCGRSKRRGATEGVAAHAGGATQPTPCSGEITRHSAVMRRGAMAANPPHARGQQRGSGRADERLGRSPRSAPARLWVPTKACDGLGARPHCWLRRQRAGGGLSHARPHAGSGPPRR